MIDESSCFGTSSSTTAQICFSNVFLLEIQHLSTILSSQLSTLRLSFQVPISGSQHILPTHEDIYEPLISAL